MKKEASVILAKCAQDKLYGIRIEKRDNDWVRKKDSGNDSHRKFQNVCRLLAALMGMVR